MQDFKKLRVWHLAGDLALRVINALPQRAARGVPGLRAQAIRAATSVGANIVEGCGRTTRSEFLQFLEITLGPLSELEAHLLIARDTRIVASDVHGLLQSDIEMVRRMLVSLIRALQRRIAEEEAVRFRTKASIK